MKKFITAIVLIILVLGSFAAMSVPHARAQTTQATLLSYSWYVAPSNSPLAASAGDLIVVGEVENTGTTALGTVSINGDAYNSTGSICPGYTTLIGVPALLPNQKAPFYMDFFPLQYNLNLPENWASNITSVKLMIGAQLNTTSTQYSGLTVPTGSVHNVIDNGVYTVTGNVENTGDQTIGNVWVLVTYYNSSGTVIGMNCTDYLDMTGNEAYGSLSSGNAVTFTATPADVTAKMSSEIANYSLLIESSPYVASSSTPTPGEGQSTPAPTPTATSSSTKTNQTSTNSLWTYIAVAAVVIVVAALIALTLFRNRRRNLQVEPPLPPPPPPPPQ